MQTKIALLLLAIVTSVTIVLWFKDSDRIRLSESTHLEILSDISEIKTKQHLLDVSYDKITTDHDERLSAIEYNLFYKERVEAWRKLLNTISFDHHITFLWMINKLPCFEVDKIDYKEYYVTHDTVIEKVLSCNK